jgi:hypothetical protein
VRGFDKPLVVVRWELVDHRNGEKEYSGLQIWDPRSQRNYFDEITHHYEYGVVRDEEESDEKKAEGEDNMENECQDLLRFEKGYLVVLRAGCNTHLDGGMYEVVGKNLVRTKPLKQKHWDLLHHMSPHQ